MGIYTKEEQFELIKKFPFNLERIDNQYEEVCLKAVKNDGRVLKYVKEQTLEICLEAVVRDKIAFKYVEPKLIPYVCFNMFLGCYDLLFSKDIKEGLEQFINNKYKIENSIFCLSEIDYIKNDNDYIYLNIDSLIYVKDFLIKGNSNNTYILKDVFFDKVPLELLKELALSNNKLVIIDTGYIEEIDKVLANRIIKEYDLYKESF